ncbi:hypothetical protein GMRT_10325 [Giardia muris]|uniref:Uncharacterized protein n=1 Tax=Giardia muris TaxID=5742 RepID=A0A4Z1SWE6_GIAMU|nr:hypothetical protein GMRT_10325 [Giardia muris]|eukprot:TNJ29900.1 hypothetical protein GMRT_10325 [Giardia muris]
MEPEYSIRINPFSHSVIFNARLKVPDSVIKLNVQPERLYLDTLGYSKKYLLDIPYPRNARVDDTRATVTFTGNNLTLRVPAVSYDGLEETSVRGYRCLLRNLPQPDSDERDEPDDDVSAPVHTLSGPLPRARDRLLARNLDPTTPHIPHIPMKHRRSVQNPAAFPAMEHQKKPKYVTSEKELVRIARKAAKNEVEKFSARIEKKQRDEEKMMQYAEARAKMKELKHSKKKMITERAKARLEKRGK